MDDLNSDQSSGIATENRQNTSLNNNTKPYQASPINQTTSAIGTAQPIEDSIEGSKSRNNKKKKVIILIAIGLVTLLSVATFLVIKNKPKSTEPEVSQSNTSQEDRTVDLNNIKFLDAPEKLDYIPFLSDKGIESIAIYYDYDNDSPSLDNTKNGMVFEKIGQTGSTNIILVKTNMKNTSVPNDSTENNVYFILSEQKDIYTVFLRNSYLGYETNSLLTDDKGVVTKENFARETNIDQNTTIEALVPNDTISFNGITAKSMSSSPRIINENTIGTLNEVEKTDKGIIYEQLTQNTEELRLNINQFSILLKQPSGLYVIYSYGTDILSNDSSIEINYNNGTSATEDFSYVATHLGCGQMRSITTLSKEKINDLEEIGEAGGGPIYRLKSSKDPIMTQYYKNTYFPDNTKPLTQDEFWKNNGVLVTKNKLGHRVILLNQSYQVPGECDKKDSTNP